MSSETPQATAMAATLTRTFTLRTTLATAAPPLKPSRLRTRRPEFTSVPADYTVECSDEMPMDDATASDNCSDVSITVESETIAGDAAGNYTIVRTFTATDAVATALLRARRSRLKTRRLLSEHPADYTAECSDELIDDATATDNCGEVTIEVSSETPQATAGSYTVTRTFTATDDAGNSSSATQTITVEDTTAPESRAFLPTRWSARRCPGTASDTADGASQSSETIAGDAAATTRLSARSLQRSCGNSTSRARRHGEDTTA